MQSLHLQLKSPERQFTAMFEGRQVWHLASAPTKWRSLKGGFQFKSEND